MAKAGIYLFTETAGNVALLQMLLPDALLQKIKLEAGGSYAATLAATRELFRNEPEARAVLVLDADTEHPARLEERHSFIEHYLSIAAAKEQFAIFLQAPEIERIAFENKLLTEKILDRSLTDLEFKFAKENPRKNLEFFMSTENPLQAIAAHPLKQELSEEMRQFAFPKELITYLETLLA